ncbi:rab-GTPase-TBC domain-containing protein [Phascolomyces articulosus]|uniref:Rab-GTPase-TBC domain-containing protein n=1 Tax=Phascolomyces articulosus TaxID=60185 RepID=A0AAD5P703_9FUNG|nr:rab-GTPase-TBC domain-containing protein [Phascolomyces articulosus]
MPPEPTATATATTPETAETTFHSSGPVKHDLHSPVSHHPNNNNYEDEDDSSSEHDSEEDGERFSLCDYDLDVVDEALMNPNNNEYRDHFGFRIQVKTDDEDESSDSESDMSSDDEEDKSSKNKTTSSSGGGGSDTDYSVDTALTTPITTKHPNVPSLPPLEIEPHSSAPTVASTARRARGRAATISKPNTFTLPQQQDSPVQLSSSGSEGTTMIATPGRRRRATTVSRPQPPPIPTIPQDYQTSSNMTKGFETVGEEEEEESHHSGAKETSQQQSIVSEQYINLAQQQQHAYLPSLPQQQSKSIVEEKEEVAAVNNQQQQSPFATTVAEPAKPAAHLLITKKEKEEEPVIDQLSIAQQGDMDDYYHAMGMEQENVSTYELESTMMEQHQQLTITEQQVNDASAYHTLSNEHTLHEKQTLKEGLEDIVLTESPTTAPTTEQSPSVERHSNDEEEQQRQQPSIELQQTKELPPLPPPTTTDSHGSIPMAISKSTTSGSSMTISNGTTSDHESIRSTTSSESNTNNNINNRSRSDSVGAKSYTSSSFNPFRRAGSPSSIRTGTRPVERPSTAYRERQSKRMSEFYRFQSQPSSPSTPFQGVNNRLSYASASSYYDMLMSKFGRSSEDHPPPLPRTSASLMRDSPKQTALKEEAKQFLEELKVADPEQQYDYQFWELFIQDTDDMMRSQPESVKHQMIAGMPTSLRGYIWQIMSKSRNNGELESEYRELLKRISPHEKSIQRDLARTFPTHDFFKERDGEGQESLFNVTKAYSLFDQQVGYCQGLPFIVGSLLLHMPDDMAFCVLIKLMSQYGLRGQFMPQMELLHERLYQFEHILQQKLPQIHRHLEVQGVQPSMYASQWFLTLFASKCPLHLAFRVFDMVLLEGAHVVLRFALALMFRNQHTLLNLEFEALVDFLNNAVFDTYKDDENGFVHDAYSMDIPTRLLTRLAKQHATEAAREAKSQSQEEHLRRINTELSSHVRRLEKSYRNLEHEHQEVTKQVIDAKMSVARMDDENQQLRWQLSQVRTELEQLKIQMPVVEDVQRQNKHLVQKNGELEGQLEDVEAILISLKMKYAESESGYEEMKQKLHKAGIVP